MRRLPVVLVLCVAGSAAADREPVLPQIDLPHPYYYREMYLPQLTSGPSSAAWWPDGKSLVYSMAGSLWRQRLDSPVAEELTAGPGYDYQPDVSPDGRYVVYASYTGAAVELQLLEVASGRTAQLTQGGAVNVEPRFSPDGKRIVWVSTTYQKRFHLFWARLEGGALAGVERLTGETRTELPRYYYSAFDHELSPTWSPDGSELIFVSNRGHIYGTGGLWRMKAQPGAPAREIHFEETEWKARPDWAPDGKRLVYSSYAGRQWQQLWLLPAAGGDPLPLTFGEWDATGPRVAPDGRHVAFISNQDGNTALVVLGLPGGDVRRVVAGERRHHRPMGRLAVSVLDARGRPVAARLSVTGADGRAYAPESAWMQADDGFDRAEKPFEAHYFHATGKAELWVPAGPVHLQVTRGFENRVARRTIEVAAGGRAAVTVRLVPLPPLPGGRWLSGDLHAHMNYAGAYHNAPAHLALQAAAEDVAVVWNLIVNKEQRIPDVAYAGGVGRPDPASTAATVVVHGQEYHTSYFGHLALLGARHLVLPDFTAYPGTAMASPAPTNAEVADLAHADGALVGYVHPFDSVPDPAHDAVLTHELPVDVALGKVDYLEVMGFSDHKSTAAVWYRLLDCGFRLPAGAGTDVMANYASLRGPVGMNRVYVQVPPGPVGPAPFLEGLKRGRTFVTNGPLLFFSVGGQGPGGEVQVSAGTRELPFRAVLRSIVPVDHLEVVCDGQVARSLPLTGARDAADVTGSLPVEGAGWCLLRAWADRAEDPVLDLYPYATTSPVYRTDGRPAGRCPAADAAYFRAWLDRLSSALQAHAGWNADAERASALAAVAAAASFFVAP